MLCRHSMATTPARQSQSGGAAVPALAPVSVQHVAKASSDELLRKFADPDEEDKPRHPAPPRRSFKRSSRRVASGLSARDSGAGAGTELAAPPKRRRSLGGSSEWRAGLLLPTTTKPGSSAGRKGSAARRGGAARLDEAGIGLLLAALERTWRKTVAGASKMFVERHRTNHVQLISDMV